MDDTRKLLADYVKNGSESAFRDLVARYIALVHSTALRLADGDAHLAEDITQTVFVNLARKARTLPPGVMLGGWLHRDTCFVAGTTMRGERRRHFRERQAVAMNFTEDHTAANLALVAPILDEAINQLEPDDRTAIVLRFFEQKEFRAVGEAMGSNEDAARMRVNRAVDKLHTLLKNRGVTFSAAALGAVLAVGAVSAAPVGLAASIAATALATAATGGVTATLLKFMTMTKLKIAIVSAIAVAALAVPVVQHQSLAKLREENQTLQQQAAQLAPLQTDNERLSNLVVQANTGAKPTEKQVLELARLRNEVARLRQQTNDLATASTGIRQRGRGRGGAIVRGRNFDNITMEEFAKFIGGVLHAPIADQTGLTGAYDIDMTPPEPGRVDGRLERVTGILSNELGLQLIPFDGPFTTNEENYDRGEIAIIRNADGTYTQLTNRAFKLMPDGLYGKIGDGSFVNVAPTANIPKGGFALKLARPGAPGLRPTTGEFGPKTGLYDSATQGLPGEIANQLMKIERAKVQWAHDQNKQDTDTPTWEDIRFYLGRAPNGNMNDYTNSPDGEFIIGSVGSKALLRAGPTAEADWKNPRNTKPADPPVPQDEATTHQDACINNLRLIDAAKQQWALEHNARNAATPTMEDIKPYIGRGAGDIPVCPDGGVYTIGSVGEKPTCSIPGHALP